MAHSLRRRLFTGKSMLSIFVLCSVSALLFAGCAAMQQSGPCSCENCTCGEAESGMFSFSDERIYSIRIHANGREAAYTGEDAKAIVGMINGFTPLGTEEIEDLVPGPGIYIDILFYDSESRFRFSEDSVYMERTRYIGEKGCLDDLVQMFYNAPS